MNGPESGAVKETDERKTRAFTGPQGALSSSSEERHRSESFRRSERLFRPVRPEKSSRCDDANAMRRRVRRF